MRLPNGPLAAYDSLMCSSTKSPERPAKLTMSASVMVRVRETVLLPTVKSSKYKPMGVCFRPSVLTVPDDVSYLEDSTIYAKESNGCWRRQRGRQLRPPHRGQGTGRRGACGCRGRRPSRQRIGPVRVRSGGRLRRQYYG